MHIGGGDRFANNNKNAKLIRTREGNNKMNES